MWESVELYIKTKLYSGSFSGSFSHNLRNYHNLKKCSIATKVFLYVLHHLFHSSLLVGGSGMILIRELSISVKISDKKKQINCRFSCEGIMYIYSKLNHVGVVYVSAMKEEN